MVFVQKYFQNLGVGTKDMIDVTDKGKTTSETTGIQHNESSTGVACLVLDLKSA